MDVGSSSGSQILEQIRSTVPDISGDRTETVPHNPLFNGSEAKLPPLESLGLPQAHVTNQLIDSYFLLYNTPYPIIHEKSFIDKVRHASTSNLSTPPGEWYTTWFWPLGTGLLSQWLTTRNPHTTRRPKPTRPCKCWNQAHMRRFRHFYSWKLIYRSATEPILGTTTSGWHVGRLSA